jgi:hypothetical protein
MPAPIEELNLKLVMLHELGILDMLSARIPENTPANLARFITVLLGEDPSMWRSIMKKLKNLNLENEKDLLSELNLNRTREILSVFGIDQEKE